MFLIPTLNDILKLDVLPENIRCYEDRCPAGLDPASFPQKELLENDTGPLNQVQCRLPGVTKPERLESVYSLPRYAVTIMDRHFIY